MANHLTPDELAKEMGIDRDEVIRICIEEGVPIYHGKIDKTLFQASLESVGTAAATARQWRGPLGRAASGRALGPGGLGLPRRGRLLGGGDARLERLHEIDHGSLLDRLRGGELLAAQLRLEHRPEVTPVVARELRGLEVPCEAVDHLPRELELGVLDVCVLDRLRDLGLRVHVLCEEEGLEGERVVLGTDEAEALPAGAQEPPDPRG